VSRERRLVFGEVAELYDRYRPTYPARLIDDLVELARLGGRRSVLEVGAGTGKATVLFADRGIPMIAVEPSEEMIAIGRRNLCMVGNLEFEQGDFETWDPVGRRFALVFSAQAWHWIDPSIGYEKARSILEPDGVLAAFWNRLDWASAPARDVLVATYRRAAPDLVPDEDPMHPARELSDDYQSWRAHATAAGLGQTAVQHYEWTLTYSADEYAGRLMTSSGMRLLDDERRRAVIEEVRTAIQHGGGTLTLPQSTELCLARRPS
jgi:SAM-dependent methyltransferase